MAKLYYSDKAVFKQTGRDIGGDGLGLIFGGSKNETPEVIYNYITAFYDSNTGASYVRKYFDGDIVQEYIGRGLPRNLIVYGDVVFFLQSSGNELILLDLDTLAQIYQVNITGAVDMAIAADQNSLLISTDDDIRDYDLEMLIGGAADFSVIASPNASQIYRIKTNGEIIVVCGRRITGNNYSAVIYDMDGNFEHGIDIPLSGGNDVDIGANYLVISHQYDNQFRCISLMDYSVIPTKENDTTETGLAVQIFGDSFIAYRQSGNSDSVILKYTLGAGGFDGFAVSKEIAAPDRNSSDLEYVRFNSNPNGLFLTGPFSAAPYVYDTDLNETPGPFTLDGITGPVIAVPII